MNITHTFSTAKRRYEVRQDDWTGMFFANYQPINAKTGKPWQARRYLTQRHNAHVCFCWSKGDGKVVRQEQFQPGAKPLDGWRGTWDSYYSGFASEQDALLAVQADARKRGETIN
jgi:hypothetical protein